MIKTELMFRLCLFWSVTDRSTSLLICHSNRRSLLRAGWPSDGVMELRSLWSIPLSVGKGLRQLLRQKSITIYTESHLFPDLEGLHFKTMGVNMSYYTTSRPWLPFPATIWLKGDNLRLGNNGSRNGRRNNGRRTFIRSQLTNFVRSFEQMSSNFC